MKENIEEDIEILKSIDCLDDIELEQAIKAVTTELERLQKEHTDLTVKMLDWRNKSIKLEAENEELKTLIAHKNGYTEQLEQDLFENANNYVISKQKIKDKIDKLQREFDFYAGREHAEWRDGEFDGDVCDDLCLQIKVLKELLEEEN